MSRRHAIIENSGDGIYLRDLGSANGTFVNGVQVRDAVLHPDDQIAFDRNRFLLEAPGLPARERGRAHRRRDAPNITQTMRAIRLPEDERPAAPAEERNRNDIWWLIGAAALIGRGHRLLLLVKCRRRGLTAAPHWPEGRLAAATALTRFKSRQRPGASHSATVRDARSMRARRSRHTPAARDGRP